jgi:aspartate 1-decarboxylase
MFMNVLKSKIHKARVTDASVDYEGSITLDRDLMDEAGLVEYEEVRVWDMTNGERLTTYVIEGERGSGMVSMNGAAAHLIKKGDTVIIACFVALDEKELAARKVRKVFVDGSNRVTRTDLCSYGDSKEEAPAKCCKAAC